MRMKLILTSMIVVTFLTMWFSTVSSAQNKFVINPTGQTKAYNLEGEEIAPPSEGSALYGQDCQFVGDKEFDFVDNGDGTVSDKNTKLMWQQVPVPHGMTWAEAVKYCENLELGGYKDWRLPNVKELFSISNFETGWPYIDTTYFVLGTGKIAKNEQYWTENKYKGITVEGQGTAAFGVNHVTGHIKAYPSGSLDAPGSRPQNMPNVGQQGPPPGGGRGQGFRGQGPGGQGQRGQSPRGQAMGRPKEGVKMNPMAKMVRAVRGEEYGLNDLEDQKDGTIIDKATGLMWAKADNGVGIEWDDALKYAQDSELGGYTDWRLPNVKELQSIVDYSRAPKNNRLKAAIDPIFETTEIVNENDDRDYGYYWTNTSACFTANQPFYFAWYVAFGRAVNDEGLDFHGAGAVRFDSKEDNRRVVEGGEERYYNLVRLVR